MRILWAEPAWDEYCRWQLEDKKTLRKINDLLKDIQRSPYSGIGKPEALKGDLSGCWSRRIDNSNRIVYRVKTDTIEVLECKGHYSREQ